MNNEQLLLLGLTGILTGMLLGIMLFFAAAVAPTVFKSLPAEHAGSYLRAIFPKYYVWGIVLAIITSAAAFNSQQTVFMLSLAVAILFMFSRQVLVPKINIARQAKLDGVKGAEQTFKKLHLFSVLINLGNMLLLFISAGVLIWYG